VSAHVGQMLGEVAGFWWGLNFVLMPFCVV
jgi:hypothetical protein